MTLLHQAAQKAVEALTFARRSLAPYGGNSAPIEAALAALESALQQQPEPVATEEVAYQRGKRAGYIDGYRAAHADERQQPDISPALQHQEEPREPVADYEQMRLTLIGQVHELLDIAERHAWTKDPEEKHRTEGSIAHARKVTAPYNYNGAASPSTTRQQEVGSFDKTGERINALAKEAGFHMEPMTNMLYTVRGNHAQLVNFARLVLAAAPSTPEKAGGVSDGVGACPGCGRFYPVHLPGCPHGVSASVSHPLPAQANDGGEHG